MERLIENITSGKISTFAQLYGVLNDIYKAYKADEWNWFLATYKKLNNCELSDESNENLISFFDRWKESSLKLLNMVLQDSYKEFEGNVKIGFGIDGNRDVDFDNVRGVYTENMFIKKMREDIEKINGKYKEIKKLIK